MISSGGLCQGDRRSIIHVTVDHGIWEVSSPRLLVARVLLSRVPRSLGADDYGAHPLHPIVFLVLPCFPAPRGGRDAILSEMTNVGGDMDGWMNRTAVIALAKGRTMGCPLGSGRVAWVANRASLNGCDTAVLPDQPDLGV